MTAIDTNVVVRFLTGDHPEQSSRARALIGSTQVTISPTVVLETAWVLKSAYRFPVPDIVTALRALGGLPTVTVERPSEIAQALDWAEAGMDIADALHLSLSDPQSGFVTFDKRMIDQAAQLGLTQVTEP